MFNLGDMANIGEKVAAFIRAAESRLDQFDERLQRIEFVLTKLAGVEVPQNDASVPANAIEHVTIEGGENGEGN